MGTVFPLHLYSRSGKQYESREKETPNSLDENLNRSPRNNQ